MAPTLSKLITRMIAEGTENGKYVEGTGNGDPVGWDPTDDPNHWVFSAWLDGLTVLIHWYGECDQRNSFTLQDEERMWDCNGVQRITRTEKGFLQLQLSNNDIVELY